MDFTRAETLTDEVKVTPIRPAFDISSIHPAEAFQTGGGTFEPSALDPMRQSMVAHDALGAPPTPGDSIVAAVDEWVERDERAWASAQEHIVTGMRRDIHWEKPVRKTIYTVNIGNYEPAITALTYPLMKNYARKIGAEFHVITDRKFPEWPVVYEKLQVHELGKGWAVDPATVVSGSARDSDGVMRAELCKTSPVNYPDWNLVIDSDCLISPEFFDITEHLTKDTVCHNGRDMAGLRWKYDQYFRRDGRHFGSCNWFTVASDWCLDLWRPLDDLTLEEALTRINPTIQETQGGHCETSHLIDDFTLSRNIARFGLKTTTCVEVCAKLGFRDQHGNGVSPYLWHVYSCSREEKIAKMLDVLTKPQNQGGWGIMSADEATEYKRKWGVK